MPQESSAGVPPSQILHIPGKLWTKSAQTDTEKVAEILPKRFAS